MKRGSSARALIAGAGEALARLIESFGTLVLVVLIAFWLAHATHDVLLGYLIGGLGSLGAILSLIYRSREGLDRALKQVAMTQSAPKHARGRAQVLEASLELSPDVVEAARHLGDGEHHGA